MLDRDGRAEAAQQLREYGGEITGRSHSDENIAREDRLHVLADHLEAEPAGYDYETAATERGEALRALLDALPCVNGDHPLSGPIARGEEVMEGVERTHGLIPLGLAQHAAQCADALADEAEQRPDADDPVIAAQIAEKRVTARALYAVSRGEHPGGATRMERLQQLAEAYPGDWTPDHDGCPFEEGAAHPFVAIIDRESDPNSARDWWLSYHATLDDALSQLGEDVLDGEIPHGVVDLDRGIALGVHIATPTVTVSKDSDAPAMPWGSA